jgi:hypothetical protein
MRAGAYSQRWAREHVHSILRVAIGAPLGRDDLALIPSQHILSPEPRIQLFISSTDASGVLVGSRLIVMRDAEEVHPKPRLGDEAPRGAEGENEEQGTPRRAAQLVPQLPKKSPIVSCTPWLRKMH